MKSAHHGRVLEAVKDGGPISALEIHRETGVPRAQVGPALAYHKNEKGRIHISGWRRDEDSGSLWLRALYSFGPGKDAPRPPRLTQAEINKRHRQKVSRIASSVFALAVPIDARRVRVPPKRRKPRELHSE